VKVARDEGRFDWAGLGWFYLLLVYFAGLTHGLLMIYGATGFEGLRQALIVSLLWLVPVLLVPRRARGIAALVGLLLWATSLVGFGYFLIYRQEFSQSVIFVLFESNLNEGSEYLGQYFAWWMVPAFVGYSLVGLFLWSRTRPLRLARPRALVASVLILVGLLGYPVVKELSKGSSVDGAVAQVESKFEPAVPWQLAVGYHKYRQQLANMEKLLAQNAQIPPLANLADANAGKPSTLVLVIGESTDRQRMSLYGYGRPTTPNLDAMRDQLTVFDDVVTPRPYTIEALQQVLTFADEEHPDLYLSTPSLLNLMRQAGYKTYWITNQQTMTKRNTMLTTFSQQADEQVYLNNNRDQNARQYDESTFEPFAKALRDPAPRKFIVVHLLGTHMRYENRYPETFARFNDAQGAPAWLSADQLASYNSYDNAVLHNDFVVSSLIKAFAASDPSGLLVYFSDHGEEVYDSQARSMLGRDEANPSSWMYTVPFIVWTSPQWRAEHPRDFTGQTARPYSTSHFIHTWADLVGLRFDGFEASKSLVSPQFAARPRLIGDPARPRQLITFDSLLTPAAKVAMKPAKSAGGEG
jgi:heptose-I-phosphate ethanolaminephosphotransferase